MCLVSGDENKCILVPLPLLHYTLAEDTRLGGGGGGGGRDNGEQKYHLLVYYLPSKPTPTTNI